MKVLEVTTKLNTQTAGAFYRVPVMTADQAALAGAGVAEGYYVSSPPSNISNAIGTAIHKTYEALDDF